MARNKRSSEEKYNAPFACALRSLLKETGTQEDLSNAVKKTRQTVSQYVNGISEPGYETLVKIADYFDVSVDYLLGRTADPKRCPTAADELGLTLEALEVLRYAGMAKRADGYFDTNHRYAIVHDFLSALICSKHFSGFISSIGRAIELDRFSTTPLTAEEEATRDSLCCSDSINAEEVFRIMRQIPMPADELSKMSIASALDQFRQAVYEYFQPKNSLDYLECAQKTRESYEHLIEKELKKIADNR